MAETDRAEEAPAAKPADFVSVMEFGADNMEITNSSPAFTAAVAAAMSRSATVPTAVLVPSGRYRLADLIVIAQTRPLAGSKS